MCDFCHPNRDVPSSGLWVCFEMVAVEEKAGQTTDGKENEKGTDEDRHENAAGVLAVDSVGHGGGLARLKVILGKEPQQQHQRPGTTTHASADLPSNSSAPPPPLPLPPPPSSAHQSPSGGNGETSRRPYSRLYQYCSSRDTPPLSARNRVSLGFRV